MLSEPIRQYLLTHRDEHFKSLCDFLSIPSIANVHDQPDSCMKAANWVADYLRRIGLEPRLMPNSATTHDRPNVVASAHVADDRPTLLIYGHYDVQPPDPLDLWTSPAFQPAVRDGYLYARGVSDDKGQVFAQLMALEAWQRAGGGLPVNVKVFIEGQEEIGSPDLEPFLAANAKLLAADAAVISDSEFFAPNLPSIVYSLRGLTYFELTLKGPSADLHSGLYGGAVANPVNALARMIAQMHDDQGRVTIPGFYDDVVPLAQEERDAWSRLPFDEAAYAASIGLKELAGGENGYSVLERLWARPTLDCTGIFGGYSGPGTKTIIPSQAAAKISMRLVPRQDPRKIVEAMKHFVARHTPPGLTATLQVYAAGAPVMLSKDSPAVRAAARAYVDGFGVEPVMIRCGASVPIAELIQRLLGVDGVLMGIAPPDSNLHSPNERMPLENLWNGSVAFASFLSCLRDADFARK